MSTKWKKQWKVPGSSGNTWTVSLDEQGRYCCSCPAWVFKRLECRHILLVHAGAIGESITQRPEYILAAVRKPIYDEKENKLYVPLIGLPDAHCMEATICFYLLKYGYTWSEIKELRRHIPSDWSARKVLLHVQGNGESEYPVGWYRN